MTMAGQWCPDCRAYVADLELKCQECRRRRCWGAILRVIKVAESDPWLFLAFEPGEYGPPAAGYQAIDRALEAVAFLMQDRQALIHQHHRAMADEQRAFSRGAGEAYDMGKDDGRREGRGDW